MAPYRTTVISSTSMLLQSSGGPGSDSGTVGVTNDARTPTHMEHYVMSTRCAGRGTSLAHLEQERRVLGGALRDVRQRPQRFYLQRRSVRQRQPSQQGGHPAPPQQLLDHPLSAVPRPTSRLDQHYDNRLYCNYVLLYQSVSRSAGWEHMSTARCLCLSSVVRTRASRPVRMSHDQQKYTVWNTAELSTAGRSYCWHACCGYTRFPAALRFLRLIVLTRAPAYRHCGYYTR